MNPTELFEQNQGLAYNLAFDYCNRFPRLLRDQDVIENYALTGLWIAALKFDATRSYEFATFARHCIEREICDGRYELSDCGIYGHPRRSTKKGRQPAIAIQGWDWGGVAATPQESPTGSLECFRERLPFLSSSQLVAVYQLIADEMPLQAVATNADGSFCWRSVVDIRRALHLVREHYPAFAYRPIGLRRVVLRAARAYAVEMVSDGPRPRDEIMDDLRATFGLQGSHSWWHETIVRNGGLEAVWLPNANRPGKTMYWRLPSAAGQPPRPRERQRLEPACGN